MKKLKRVKIFSAVKVETAENMYELFANDPNIEVSETKFSTSFDALGPRITMVIYYTDKDIEEKTSLRDKVIEELLIEQMR